MATSRYSLRVELGWAPQITLSDEEKELTLRTTIRELRKVMQEQREMRPGFGLQWSVQGDGETMVTQEHWMVIFQKIYYPVLAAIGIPSNIITFLIFWRRNCMLSRSSTFYLMAMAVADTGVLVSIVVLELVVKFHSVEPFWARQPWCSIRDLFTYGSYNASTWLVVTFTAERFLAINTWRLKLHLCTPRSALWAIGSIFVLSHLLAVPHLWANASEYDQQLDRWRCVYNAQAPTLFIHSLVGFQTLLSYVLPFLIILTLNGLTLRQISKCNHIQPVCEPPVSPVSPKLRLGPPPPLLRSRRRKSVVLLVTVSMTFLLLSVVRAVTQFILRITSSPELERQDYGLSLNVAADLGTMLCLSNAAVNMYLYAATQTRFRQEVIACAKRCLSVMKSCLTPSTT